MAHDLPYLPTYKNLGKLFERIQAAKVPDGAFTHDYLSNTIGIKSAGDRPLIPLLKALGFLDASGKPTTEYASLKNKHTAKQSIAEAIRRAYKPLFDADEKAHQLPQEELKGLVAQVAGTDEGMTSKIVGTFNALVKLADFTGEKTVVPIKKEGDESEKHKQLPHADKLRSEFHYNIQIHLPSNGTEETYLNIFNAIRKTFV